MADATELQETVQTQPRLPIVCPTTHMQVTPSGWCDDCEDFHRPSL